VVAIDATPLLGDRTGVGVAVTGMIKAVAEHRDLSLIGYGFTAAGWRRLRARLPSGVRAGRGPMPASALLGVWSRLDHPVIERWTGPVDVVHGTNFVVPPSRRAARLVSVWDLTAVRWPELVSPASRRYPELIARAVAQGAWVHTGAGSVADEIVEHFGIDRQRVFVIPPGVDIPAQAAAEPGGQPYVLGLGTTEPRKDFPTLVAGFGRLAPSNLELRIAGPPGWAEGDLAAAIERSPARDRIRRLGWVDDVPSLMAGAALFVYPSLYEGFGLPPLEAMALGVPVVATATGAIPEVVGDAALLVDPGDADALAQAIDTVLHDDDTRRRLVERGRARAAGFTWPAAGSALAAAYRRAAGA
jgi:glycosyltransferase involved in cell wall biosynthesis